MKISILCTDRHHPVVGRLKQWSKCMETKKHTVSLVFDRGDLVGGDILFLVSCAQIIDIFDKKKFTSTLVLHASDLPKRRGWSPHIWAILCGENEITVSLFEATEPVDTGMIWLKKSFLLEGHELLDEINAKLFDTELFLMTQAIENYHNIQPTNQAGDPGNYMRKRIPADSRIDPEKSISEQFNLLRVVDSSKYPAFFRHKGFDYHIKIEKVKNG